MVNHIVNKVKINSMVVFVCQRLLNICLGLVFRLFLHFIIASAVKLVRTIDLKVTSLLYFT